MSIQIPLHIERPSLSSDPVNQMNTFRSYLNVLGDSQSKDESKLKAAQELNDSFDVIIAHSQYQTFLDHAIRVFIKLLQEDTPHIIAELHIQQVRKLVLEMIKRLPANDLLKPYAESIFSLTLKLMRSGFENEENVTVCARIYNKLSEQRPNWYTAEQGNDTKNQQFQKCKTELQIHLGKSLVKGEFLVFDQQPLVQTHEKICRTGVSCDF